MWILYILIGIMIVGALTAIIINIIYNIAMTRLVLKLSKETSNIEKTEKLMIALNARRRH